MLLSNGLCKLINPHFGEVHEGVLIRSNPPERVLSLCAKPEVSGSLEINQKS